MTNLPEVLFTEMLRTNDYVEGVARACMCIVEVFAHVRAGDPSIDKEYSAALAELYEHRTSLNMQAAIYQFAWEIEKAWERLDNEEVLEHIGTFDWEWIPFVMYQLHEKRKPSVHSKFHIFDARSEDILEVTRNRLEEMMA